MIHVTPPHEPEDFDARVRRPGAAWFAKQPTPKPRDYWCLMVGELASGFHDLCAYAAMWISDGTVDHYLSSSHHTELAYEWSNYRYASHRMNSFKGAVDEKVLDPFSVEDGWFEIILPSLQLVLTEAIPADQRTRAEYTLGRLHLRDGEMVIRQRQAWYEMYRQGTSLEVIKRKAPLIARAIRKQAGEAPRGRL